jgi:predicted AlkP superfamily phosphohydrolase/phosphomutase
LKFFGSCFASSTFGGDGAGAATGAGVSKSSKLASFGVDSFFPPLSPAAEGVLSAGFLPAAAGAGSGVASKSSSLPPSSRSSSRLRR